VTVAIMVYAKQSSQVPESPKTTATAPAESASATPAAAPRAEPEPKATPTPVVAPARKARPPAPAEPAPIKGTAELEALAKAIETQGNLDADPNAVNDAKAALAAAGIDLDAVVAAYDGGGKPLAEGEESEEAEGPGQKAPKKPAVAKADDEPGDAPEDDKGVKTNSFAELKLLEQAQRSLLRIHRLRQRYDLPPAMRQREAKRLSQILDKLPPESRKEVRSLIETSNKRPKQTAQGTVRRARSQNLDDSRFGSDNTPNDVQALRSRIGKLRNKLTTDEPMRREPTTTTTTTTTRIYTPPAAADAPPQRDPYKPPPLRGSLNNTIKSQRL